MTAYKCRVELPESKERRLMEVTHHSKSTVFTMKRALALLKGNEGHTDGRIAEALSISRHTVVRVRRRFCEEGQESELIERSS